MPPDGPFGPENDTSIKMNRGLYEKMLLNIFDCVFNSQIRAGSSGIRRLIILAPDKFAGF
jgi:hypothetical protein